MDSSRFSIKLFVQSPTDYHVEQIVPVFHSWIQMHSIENHLLIDVSDYAHVHHGPGILLAALEANYTLDTRDGRLGLTYQRKQPLEGTLAQRVRAAYDAVRQAASLLAEQFTFRDDEIEFRICDRLHAPNTQATFEAVKPALAEVFAGAKLEYVPSDQKLFTVIIRR